MALFIERHDLLNRPFVRGTLATSLTATTDGTWEDLRGFYPITVVLSGDFVGAAEVRVSNSPNIPTNSEHGAQLGSNLVAAGSRLVSAPYRWIKLRVTTYTSGTIDDVSAYGG